MTRNKTGPKTWVPKLGQAVRWPLGTEREIWTVKAINDAKAEATLFREGIIRLAPCAQLEPIGGHVRTTPKVDIPRVEDDLERLRSRQKPRLERVRLTDIENEKNLHAPAKPRRLVDGLVDDIEFSASCLQYYKRRYLRWRRATLAEVEEELRRELRRGDFLPATRSERYGQIQTKRLAIHLTHQPTCEEPLLITRLYTIPQRDREAA